MDPNVEIEREGTVKPPPLRPEEEPDVNRGEDADDEPEEGDLDQTDEDLN